MVKNQQNLSKKLFLSLKYLILMTFKVKSKQKSVMFSSDFLHGITLGLDLGYTVKYNPLSSGVPSGEARGNSFGQRVIFDRISLVLS